MGRKSRSRKAVMKAVPPLVPVVVVVPEPPVAPIQLLDIEEGSQEALESLTPEQVAKRKRRLIGNANERRRMQQINEGFEGLRGFLNDTEERKLVKGELLKRTVSMVGNLIQENAGLIQKGNEMERTLTQKGVNWKQVLVQEKEKSCGLHNMAAALGLVPTGINREESPSGGSGKPKGRNKRSRKAAPAPEPVMEPEEEDDGIGLSSASQQFSSQSQSISQVKEEGDDIDIDLQMEVADLRYEKAELQAAVDKEQSEKGYLEAQLADLQKRNKALREEAKFKEDKLTRKIVTGGTAGAGTTDEEGADGKKSGNLGDIVEAIRIIEGGDDDAEKAKLEEGDDTASEGSEDTENARKDGDDGQNALEEDSQGSGDGDAAAAGNAGEGEVKIAATQDEFIFPSP